MSVAEIIPTDPRADYRRNLKDVDVRERTRMRVVSVTDTHTQSSKRHEVSYSVRVRRNFVLGSVLVVLSGFVSLAGVISEQVFISIIGAIILASGLVCLYRWLEKAHAETKQLD